jgi:hypothetical protein
MMMDMLLVRKILNLNENLNDTIQEKWMIKYYFNDESAFSGSNNERLLFNFSVRGLWFYKRKKMIKSQNKKTF